MTEENFESPRKTRRTFQSENDRYLGSEDNSRKDLAEADSAIVHHDKQVWTDPHPVEEIHITDFAEQHPDEVGESIIPIKKTKEVVIKIGKLHAIFWLLIVASGIVWSFLFAAAIFTGFGSYQVSLMGVLGTLVLAATVFSLSKDNVAIEPRRRISGVEK